MVHITAISDAGSASTSLLLLGEDNRRSPAAALVTAGSVSPYTGNALPRHRPAPGSQPSRHGASVERGPASPGVCGATGPRRGRRLTEGCADGWEYPT